MKTTGIFERIGEVLAPVAKSALTQVANGAAFTAGAVLVKKAQEKLFGPVEDTESTK